MHDIAAVGQLDVHHPPVFGMLSARDQSRALHAGEQAGHRSPRHISGVGKSRRGQTRLRRLAQQLEHTEPPLRQLVAHRERLLLGKELTCYLREDRIGLNGGEIGIGNLACQTPSGSRSPLPMRQPSERLPA